LRYDIYEDFYSGLVVAVPAGQGLIDKPLEDSGIYMLRSQNPSGIHAFMDFEALVPDDEGYQRVAKANDGTRFLPKDQGYFNAYVEETIRDCRAFQNRLCELDPSTISRARTATGSHCH
jgi:hypothetical protein